MGTSAHFSTWNYYKQKLRTLAVTPEHIVGLVGSRMVEHHFMKITFSSTTEDNNYYPSACNTSSEI